MKIFYTNEDVQNLQNNGSAGTYFRHNQSSHPSGVTSGEKEDTRKWTPQHLEAADLRTGDLTPPPQLDLNADVNARGPGNF